LLDRPWDDSEVWLSTQPKGAPALELTGPDHPRSVDGAAGAHY